MSNPITRSSSSGATCKAKIRPLRLLEEMENRLQRINIEYAAKRESRRLGPLRLALIPENTWQQWDRARLAKTGGTLEQYKHPCLIVDPKFREEITISEELQLTSA